MGKEMMFSVLYFKFQPLSKVIIKISQIKIALIKFRGAQVHQKYFIGRLHDGDCCMSMQVKQ